MTGVAKSSGNLVMMAVRMTTTIDTTPIQFCLYGALTSVQSFSFGISPSIAYISPIRRKKQCVCKWAQLSVSIRLFTNRRIHTQHTHKQTKHQNDRQTNSCFVPFGFGLPACEPSLPLFLRRRSSSLHRLPSK